MKLYQLVSISRLLLQITITTYFNLSNYYNSFNVNNKLLLPDNCSPLSFIWADIFSNVIVREDCRYACNVDIVPQFHATRLPTILVVWCVSGRLSIQAFRLTRSTCYREIRSCVLLYLRPLGSLGLYSKLKLNSVDALHWAYFRSGSKSHSSWLVLKLYDLNWGTVVTWLDKS